jgi:hypothetical protein
MMMMIIMMEMMSKMRYNPFLKMIADKNEYSVSYYTFKNKDYNIKLK